MAADRSMRSPGVDMRAQGAMLKQPRLHAGAALREAEGGEQHEGNGWKQRQQRACRREGQAEQPEWQENEAAHNPACTRTPKFRNGSKAERPLRVVSGRVGLIYQ